MDNSNHETNSKRFNIIHETFSFGVIYIYSIPDERHKGRLKIGSATIASQKPTQEEINAAAHERIKQQTKTADVPYTLEYAELTVADDGTYFSDYEVHEILIRSGYDRRAENTRNAHSEWFEVNLEVAKNAIQAAKKRRKSLTTAEKAAPPSIQFPFRPNQLDAIDKTIKAIKQNRKHFLWNAKMRFGKTSAAMQVAKQSNMKKVLIVTHRPSVSVDWYDDFKKVFVDTDYEYSSKTKGEYISNLIKGEKPFVYFASLQDLRLSKRVVSDESSNSHAMGFPKNEEVFDTTWDMLIVDEAHEGTQSDLGETTFTKIPTNFTLQLSGTPFNILHKHEENDIYTWDYVMEQEEKLFWNERHPGVPNPYAELPTLSMFTYDIDKFASQIGIVSDSFSDIIDGAFKFHEFFRVNKDDEGNDTAVFVHEPMVKRFLDLLVDNTLNTKFPYSTEEYRNYNKHSLWLLPNRVKVIEAMEKILKKHAVFGSSEFGIVNISGDNPNEVEDKDAKDRVTNAIKNHEYTITLTGQRLTTGASIPEWTAVFMLSDTSSATTYLQTAFRCQTPARIDGKLKTQGYVFDFAPDRTLKLIAEAIELNHKSGKINTPDQKEAMGKFLNFCPILAAEGGSMKPYDVRAMLEQLKKAIIERVRKNGFDDPKLYNDELLRLSDVDIAKFNELKQIVGKSSNERVNEIEVNNLGMDELLLKKAEEAEHKKKKELTDEEIEALRKLKEAREQKNTAISILRAVSIRMPMLVYGADVKLREDISLSKFIEIVDEESWIEFMPAGLSKEKFKEFIKYYDEEVFRAVARSIRAKAFDCDDLLPTERIQALAEIFGTFKNPDKETVLTPWNVVNMHITLAFGGHDFRTINSKSNKPEWKSYGVDTSIWSKEDTKILEINSKSGLYPLLATYNFYSRLLIKHKKPEDKVFKKIWKKVLSENIYVLCKSPMAVTITRRTLAGYSGTKTNIFYVKDLVKKLQQKGEYKDYNVSNELDEKFGFKDQKMKFSAVLGNPPYQLVLGNEGGNSSKSTAIYHLFVDAALSLNPTYIALIIPSRWMTRTAEGVPAEWVDKMLDDNHISLLHDFLDANTVFTNVEIKGGVCIFLRNLKYYGYCRRYIHKRDNTGNIVLKGPYDGPIKIKGTDLVLRDIEKIPVLNKIREIEKSYKGEDYLNKSRLSFASLVSPKDFFTNKKILTSSWADYATEKSLQNNVKVYLNRNLEGNGGFGWINREAIPKNKKVVDLEKVYIPAGAGTGNDKQVLGTPFYGEPGSVCTQTYLVIGYNYDVHKLRKLECLNIIKYIKTKLFRYLVSMLKNTQNGPRGVYRLVPLQDFTEKSNIDWSKSIAEIDKLLYAKYGLSEDEINFIETHVKAME